MWAQGGSGVAKGEGGAFYTMLTVRAEDALGRFKAENVLSHDPQVGDVRCNRLVGVFQFFSA